MTREYIKSEIDTLPENAFAAFAAMFSAFLQYVETAETDDHFNSEENQAYISKSIREYEDGTASPVILTPEDLDAYGNQ
jgi:hypothetical protein